MYPELLADPTLQKIGQTASAVALAEVDTVVQAGGERIWVKERKMRAPAEMPGLCGAGITWDAEQHCGIVNRND